MYDDLLGTKQQPKQKQAKWSIFFVKQLYLDISNGTSMVFKVDTPTPSGRIYPKDEMEKTFKKATTGKGLYLVKYPPQDPIMVNPANIIGWCLGYSISDVSKEITVEMKYLKGKEDYAQFDFAPLMIGATDAHTKKVSLVNLTQLYII
jgi:hypothetical protein